mmetsp:Transcript_1043/g.1910  ORF Transcript_1043/g.1910 Transcript_1043/m.1910 type:complete len:313 (-) Transcript_1043:8-946(-)
MEGSKCFTKLNLSNNPLMMHKTGIYIGDALIQNPEHPVEKINFKNVFLEEDGLLRILEACNANKNIERVNLGFVTDKGLKLMSETIAHNLTLKKIKFQEHKDPNLKWKDKSKQALINAIKQNKALSTNLASHSSKEQPEVQKERQGADSLASKGTELDRSLLQKPPQLKKMKFEPAESDSENDHKLLKKEIQFYLKKIKKENKKEEEIDERIEACSNQKMFENLIHQIEDKEEHQRMPVRKFFNNTFDTKLNDAIFDLMKRQQKSKSNSIFTMQGSIKFVAHFLMDSLKEDDEAVGESEGEDDGDQTDEANV